MKNLIFVLSAFIVLLAASCKKNNDLAPAKKTSAVITNSVNTSLGEHKSGTTLYFAGIDGPNAVYWKNGIETTLPLSANSSNYSNVTAIVADGTDVYIAGVESSINPITNNNYNIPEYWKNGIVHTLPVTNNGSGNITGLAIASR